MYVYTEVQVQGQDLNTNKQIEVITNNELRCHCVSGNIIFFLSETPTGRYTDNTKNKIKFGRKLNVQRFDSLNVHIQQIYHRTCHVEHLVS